MRFLAVAVGIVVLIIAGHAIQAHFASSRSAEAEATPGISVYELHLNKVDMKTLPEQDAPSP